MNLFDSPLVHALGSSRRVLIAGAGGGFDVFTGLPLYFALRAAGKEVHLANLSFSRLDRATGELVDSNVLAVTADSNGQEAYFPELHLTRYLRRQGIEQPIYCIPRSGVRPVSRAYEALQKLLNPDAIILADGGTDSLMRGDEPGLGTPQEDIASLCAVQELDVPIKLLVCLGFGIDTFHGVSHVSVLESVAALARENAYLGAFSLMSSMPEYQAFKAATQAAIQEMPRYPSIVNTSIISAVDGEFGNHHASERTQGSELFINPLMALYWVFQSDAVARRNLYIDSIRDTETYIELSARIETFRAKHSPIKKWRELPM